MRTLDNVLRGIAYFLNRLLLVMVSAIGVVLLAGVAYQFFKALLPVLFG